MKKPRKAKAPSSAKKPGNKSSAAKQKLDLSALSALLAGEDLSRRQHKENVNLMCSRVEEYLSSFIIIGYSIEGEPVNVTYAASPRDYDALSTGLQKYIVDSLYKNQFPPGNMT